jgi:hypothetical protein
MYSETYVPFSKVFNSRNRLNDWAKIGKMTKSPSYGEYFRSCIPMVVDVIKTENKPCDRPFPAIRKWKTWGIGNFYTGKQCHH